MKKNKFVKVIEHILVALPLIYVGGVASYTIFNKNAVESYYNANSYTLDTLSVVDDFEIGNTYYFANEEFVTYGNTNGQSIMGVSNFVYHNAPMDDCNNIRFYSVGNDTLYIVGYDINNTMLFQNPVTATTTFFSFTFEGIRFASSSTTIAPFLPYFTYRVYDSFSFLNNAIPYAMSEFNKLGFNKINFTGFFVNIFHNGETNVYIDFLNNYLNYMLFVETCYVLPMVLYWFIHMGEDIINRFSHKEW